MEKVNLAENLSRFGEPWSPRIVGELNGQLARGLRSEPLSPSAGLGTTGQAVSTATGLA